jgi:hypothetical protein
MSTSKSSWYQVNRFVLVLIVVDTLGVIVGVFPQHIGCILAACVLLAGLVGRFIAGIWAGFWQGIGFAIVFSIVAFGGCQIFPVLELLPESGRLWTLTAIIGIAALSGGVYGGLKMR